MASADLPLHDGHVPPWMLKLMKGLAEAIVEIIVDERGVEGLVRGLADPFWFQAFNNVIGMDWDSSGSTTVVVSLLKQISWEKDLGFLVLGGKGARMLKVDDEAKEAERRLGIDSDRVSFFSKATARAASVMLQDGYDIYEHAVIVTERGPALTIEQGMNLELKMARRYHIDKAAAEEPFSGVLGVKGQVILNATASESARARKAYLDILAEGKERILRYLAEANAALGAPSLLRFVGAETRPATSAAKGYYRPVMPSKQLMRSLEELTSNPPTNEVELMVAKGLGPKTLRALALIADVIYSIPTSTRDPVTLTLDPFGYAYAVGGKDGVPYPFDKSTAIKAIEFLREAIESARLGNVEKLKALHRLRLFLARSLGREGLEAFTR